MMSQAHNAFAFMRRAPRGCLPPVLGSARSGGSVLLFRIGLGLPNFRNTVVHRDRGHIKRLGPKCRNTRGLGRNLLYARAFRPEVRRVGVLDPGAAAPGASGVAGLLVEGSAGVVGPGRPMSSSMRAPSRAHRGAPPEGRLHACSPSQRMIMTTNFDRFGNSRVREARNQNRNSRKAVVVLAKIP